jgi:hypothetical protein
LKLIYLSAFFLFFSTSSSVHTQEVKIFVLLQSELSKSNSDNSTLTVVELSESNISQFLSFRAIFIIQLLLYAYFVESVNKSREPLAKDCSIQSFIQFLSKSQLHAFISSLFKSSHQLLELHQDQVVEPQVLDHNTVSSVENIELVEHSVCHILIVGGNTVQSQHIIAGIHSHIGTHSGGPHSNSPVSLLLPASS